MACRPPCRAHPPIENGTGAQARTKTGPEAAWMASRHAASFDIVLCMAEVVVMAHHISRGCFRRGVRGLHRRIPLPARSRSSCAAFRDLVLFKNSISLRLL